MGGRGAKSSVNRSSSSSGAGSTMETKVENGKTFFKTNIYGREWITEKELDDMINTTKISISKMNTTINESSGSQKEIWKKKKKQTEDELSMYKRTKAQAKGKQTKDIKSTPTRKVLKKLPKGWGEIEGALTAPRGYVWVSNKKSRFGGERKQAIIKIDDLRNSK